MLPLGQAQQFQQCIQDAQGLGAHDEAPDQGDHDARHHDGEDQQKSVPVLTPLAAQIENELRRQHREDENLDQGRGQDDPDVLEGCDKDEVREKGSEVFQADPGGNAGTIPAREGMKHRGTGRVVAEDQDEGEGRQKEEVQVPGLPEFRPEVLRRIHRSRLRQPQP